MRFQQTLLGLAMIDEGFNEDQAGLGLAGITALDPKTAALLQLGRRWRWGHRRSAWSGVLGYDIAAALEEPNDHLTLSS